VSTVGAVLDALTALGAATLPTFQVITGADNSVTTTTPRVLAIGDQPITGESTLDSLDLGTRTERYSVPLAVSVSLPGASTQGAAITAAMDAYTALELAIREFPGGASLGLGEGVNVSPVGGFELRPTATEQGRQAAVRFSVAVFAQTT
jgi:hypothetical protein